MTYWRPRPGPGGPVVACVGETMAALAPADAGPLEEAGLLGLDIAGAESNVAMYLADHGIRSRWVSRVGDDPFGRRVLARVAASGVDVSGTLTDPARPTGLLAKDLGPDGTRVHYYRRGSAASAMTPALLETSAITTASLVHLTGITPALSDSCRDLVAAALTGPVRPAAVSFDVNHRAALWPYDPGETLRDLAELADVTFVGLDEAQALWGGHLRTAGDVRRLLPSPRILVVKDGPHAATAFTAGRQVTVPALRVEVVEPVGAGDAFAAGFLAGLLRGESLTSALRLAHLTATAALTVTGDHGPLPSSETLHSLLETDEAGWTEAVSRDRRPSPACDGYLHPTQ